MTKFAGILSSYIKQSGLSLRKIASQAGIPHQTLHNWVRGSRPRWYTALPSDLYRLGVSLCLADDEITHILRLANCSSPQTGRYDREDVPMENALRIPKRWTFGGDAPQKYGMGLDPGVTYENRPCVTIKSLPECTDFGALFQECKADAFQGKRLRFSAAVRAEAVENMAALWMRVDGPHQRMIAFDNMRDRPIVGTSDWTHYSIVLDIAQEAVQISYGFFLSLAGQVWMADVRLDVVELDVPTTDLIADLLQELPANLGFEE